MSSDRISTPAAPDAAIPVDLKTDDPGFEAVGFDGFRRALERLVADEPFREAILADPNQGAAEYGLGPGQMGLLLATAWAAYGPDVEGHGLARF